MRPPTRESSVLVVVLVVVPLGPIAHLAHHVLARVPRPALRPGLRNAPAELVADDDRGDQDPGSPGAEGVRGRRGDRDAHTGDDRSPELAGQEERLRLDRPLRPHPVAVAVLGRAVAVARPTELRAAVDRAAVVPTLHLRHEK